MRVSKAAAQNALDATRIQAAPQASAAIAKSGQLGATGCDDPVVLAKINEPSESLMPIMATWAFGPFGQVPPGQEKQYKEIVDAFHKVRKLIRDAQEVSYDKASDTRVCAGRYIVDNSSLSEQEQALLDGVAQVGNMLGNIDPQMHLKLDPISRRVCRAGPLFYTLRPSSSGLDIRWDCERVLLDERFKARIHHPNLQEFLASK